MRTLVDLLNDDGGYVRIFAEQTGFGYARSTYSVELIGDLFDRMSGYSSINCARAAAQLQLQASNSPKRSRRKRAR